MKSRLRRIPSTINKMPNAKNTPQSGNCKAGATTVSHKFGVIRLTLAWAAARLAGESNAHTWPVLVNTGRIAAIDFMPSTTPATTAAAMSQMPSVLEMKCSMVGVSDGWSVRA